MDQMEFAARVEALRQRLYRTAYLYLGGEADALEAVDEAVYQALRGLRKLWALSGLHDLHVLKPLFHSGAEMGQEILRGDELLPKPL